MKKLVFVIFVALVLIGCGGDDGDPAPADISGYWQGGGTMTATRGGQTESGVAIMNVYLEPMGFGQYYAQVHLELVGYWARSWEDTWLYQNANIGSGQGRASGSMIVRGNRIEINTHVYLGDILVQTRITLYRY